MYVLAQLTNHVDATRLFRQLREKKRRLRNARRKSEDLNGRTCSDVVIRPPPVNVVRHQATSGSVFVAVIELCELGVDS